MVSRTIYFHQVPLSRKIYLEIFGQLKSGHPFTEVSLNGVITSFDSVDDITWS